MGHLLQGYQLCAATEGKSPNAIAIVTNSVSYFRDFLVSQGISTDITQISQHEIRAFLTISLILSLPMGKQKTPTWQYI
jgi:hypothetical protein